MRARTGPRRGDRRRMFSDNSGEARGQRLPKLLRNCRRKLPFARHNQSGAGCEAQAGHLIIPFVRVALVRREARLPQNVLNR